jgi:surface polysaccharide O-acyltransferase-like enzyme
VSFSAYRRGVDEAVARTPADRNRVVDTWRVVALMVVVFGHWLAASVWVSPDGDIVVMNTLEWIPYAGWFTWIVQVMPIFFFVGGYANARALEKRTTNRRTWLILRFRRLSSPAIPVIVVWTLLVVVLRPFVDADLVYDGTLNATIPLWFLAVYLTLVSIAPLTLAAWHRWGVWTIGAFAAAAVATDFMSRGLDLPGAGWANLVFVWGAIHQAGYWWATREREGRLPSVAAGLSVSALSVTALALVTSVGWYPVAMITIPGAGPDNVIPPTSAILLLAAAQGGIIMSTRKPVAHWAKASRTWRLVVGVSGFMMTIYVWHLTALSLAIAVGIFAFDGAAFSPEPGTAIWWLSRPLFFPALVAVTAALVAGFGVFERDIDTTPEDRPMPVVVLGMAATIVALGATAFVYLVDRDASINGWIPALAVVAAVLTGAYPDRWNRRFRRRSSSAHPPSSTR